MGGQIEEITSIVKSFYHQDDNTSRRFLQRVQEGQLTRDENNRSHFCVYFLPYNPVTKEVFIVHHKKSGLWISPGGHIDKDEYLLQALNREIMEELGVSNFFPELPKPFLLTITPIENTTQPCKEHLDIWFLVETDGSNFNVDPQEFYNTKWLNLAGAKKIVTNRENLQALVIVQNKH